MIQKFKDFPLKFKLIFCFLLIICIYSVAGIYGLRIMTQMSDLVNKTYDKALMSSTFAQSAKFEFSQYDSEVKSALLSDDQAAFEKSISRSKKAHKTFEEDLKIAKERALSPKSAVIIDEILKQIDIVEEKKQEFLEKKKVFFQNKIHANDSYKLYSEWDILAAKKVALRKLTALYDDAAEVGYHFRLSSEEKNTRIIQQSFWVLLTCILMSLALSIGVSFLIIRPLFNLEAICLQFGLGNYSTRAKVTSRDEFGTLASSFNFMLETIQDKNENISSLLSSLPFGLFYFDRLGLISKERSQSTDIIFENFNRYTDLSVFFAAHNCNAKQVGEVLKATFQGLIPFDSAVFLFPDIIYSGDRTIHLSFKPKYGPKKKLERVIVLAEDITEKNRALEESRELSERVERVSKASSDIEGFKEFIPAARKYFTDIMDLFINYNESEDSNLKRELHSLKGLLSVYSFNVCVSKIHDIESFIIEDIHSKTKDAFSMVRDLQNLFDTQTQDIVDLLALNKDTGLKYFDINKINNLKDLISLENNPVLNVAIRNLDRFPLEKVLTKYSSYAQEIADKLEDKKVRLIFEPSDEITYEEVQKLDTVLVHVLNNSIDHGIETSSERLALHKNEIGEVRISCKRNSDQSLVFKISDDGKGIDSDYLVMKAVKMGIVDPEAIARATDNEKLNLIFLSGLSSKEEATEISGRGVGMDVIKKYLESLGGSIALSTRLGMGTTFELNLPSLDHLLRARQ